MRFLRLSFEGVGPFLEPQFIDFNPLVQANGLYLIHGNTGSGKTTILDAIMYALYGQTTSSVKDSKYTKMRSTFMDISKPSFVQLDFENKGELWRVRRVPEYVRPSLRNKSMLVTENMQCDLYRFQECSPQEEAQYEEQVAAGQSESGETAGHTQFLRYEGKLYRVGDALASGKRAVGIEMTRILSLSADEFCQTVILPQGNFSKFLYAESSKRQAVLRQIFQTAIYDRAEAIFEERAKEATAKRSQIVGEFFEGVKAFNNYLDQMLKFCPEVLPSPELEELSVKLKQPRDKNQLVLPRWAEQATQNWALISDYTAQIGGYYEQKREQVDRVFRQCSALHSTAQFWQHHRQDYAQMQLTRQQLNEQAPLYDRAKQLLERDKQAQTVQVDVRRWQDQLQRWSKGLSDLQSQPGAQFHVLLPVVQKAHELCVLADEDSSAITPGDLLPVGEEACGCEEVSVGENAPQNEKASVGEVFETLLGRVSQLSEQQVRLVQESTTKLKEKIDALGIDLQNLNNLQRLQKEIQAAAKPIENSQIGIQKLEKNIEKLRAKILTNQHYLAERTAYVKTLEAEERAFRQNEHKLAVTGEPVELLIKSLQQINLADECRENLNKLWLQLQQALKEFNHLEGNFERAALLDFASRLKPGQPCLVCGATEHPSPVGDGQKCSSQQQSLMSDGGFLAEILVATRKVTQYRQEIKAVLGRELDKVRQEIKQGNQQNETDNQSVTQELQSLAERRENLQYLLECQSIREKELTDKLVHYELEQVSQLASVKDKLARELDEYQKQLDTFSQVNELAQNVLMRQQDIKMSLREQNFESVQQAYSHLLDSQGRNRVQTVVKTYEKEYSGLEVQEASEWYAQFTKIKDNKYDLEEIKTELEKHKKEVSEIGGLIGSWNTLYQQAEKIWQNDIVAVKQQSESLFKKTEALVRLGMLAKGGAGRMGKVPLSTWAVLKRFRETLIRSNLYLKQISRGRYQLVAADSDGSKQSNQALSLQVQDAYDSESNLRMLSTLSGGESFYCSLSLALGLASVISEMSGLKLYNMFIDEGFGTLDENTCEQVIETLKQTASSGRSVGLISHVNELRDLIGNQIRVHSQYGKPSTLEVITS